MKKFSLILVAMLAVTAFAATFALGGDCDKTKAAQAKAGCDKPCPTETMAKAASADAKAGCDKPCPTKTAGKACDKPCPTTGAAKAAMGDCCIDAALAHEGCCGKDAEAVHAAFTACPIVKTALTGMHECCAEAVAEGKGCCGKDAKGLKADFHKKLEEAREKDMASL